MKIYIIINTNSSKPEFYSKWDGWTSNRLKAQTFYDFNYANEVADKVNGIVCVKSFSFKEWINELFHWKLYHNKLNYCQSGSDGECNHPGCPQIKDHEPHRTGRSCPLPHWTDDEEY